MIKFPPICKNCIDFNRSFQKQKSLFDKTSAASCKVELAACIIALQQKCEIWILIIETPCYLFMRISTLSSYLHLILIGQQQQNHLEKWNLNDFHSSACLLSYLPSFRGMGQILILTYSIIFPPKCKFHLLMK